MRQQQGPHTPFSALFHLLCPCQSSQEREKGQGKKEFGIPQIFATCRLRARPWGFGSPGWLGRLWVTFRCRTHKVADGNPPVLGAPALSPRKTFGWLLIRRACRRGALHAQNPTVGARGEVTAQAPLWGARGWVLAVGACPGRALLLLPGGCWRFVAPGSPSAACASARPPLPCETR